MKYVWCCAVAIAATFVPSLALHAQTFPTKPIRIVVPYPPGGGVDIMARTVATRLPDSLGQQVIVDNRPGGGTVIGTELVARSAPDGYTLLMANIAFGANPALHKKLPYDTEKDFTPVALVALLPSFLVVHPSLPVNSLRELVNWANVSRISFEVIFRSYSVCNLSISLVSCLKRSDCICISS